MRQIAEFVAVLACGLFTGAAVYVSLVEHPARMECGIEIAATEFPPSYRRASVMQAILGSRGSPCFGCGVARGGDILVARWRDRAGLCRPIHTDCDPTDQ